MRPPYAGPETRTSKDVLRDLVTSGLPEPVMLLGGWGVYFTVHSKWNAAYAEDYFGSRDIDIGFHTPPDAPKYQLKDSNLPATLRFLIDRHHFTPQGMYQVVRYHSWTDHRVLRPAAVRQMGMHEYYAIVVDLVASHQRDDLREIVGFQAFSEPLLDLAFTDPIHRTEIDLDGSTIWVPAPHLLVGMKLKSLPDRTKDDKITKDLCDLFALITAAPVDPRTIRSRLRRVQEETDALIDKAIQSPFIDDAAAHLDQPADTLKAAYAQLA